MSTQDITGQASPNVIPSAQDAGFEPGLFSKEVQSNDLSTQQDTAMSSSDTTSPTIQKPVNTAQTKTQPGPSKPQKTYNVEIPQPTKVAEKAPPVTHATDGANMYTPKQINRIKQQAFEQAKAEFEQSEQRKLKEQQELTNKHLQSLQQQFKMLEELQLNSHNQIRESAVHIASAMVDKLFEGLTIDDKFALISGHINSYKDALIEQKMITINVHPSMKEKTLSYAQQMLDDSVFKGRLEVVEDASIAQYDITLDTDNGGFEVNHNALIESIRTLVYDKN